jgi:pimeloyl-ACP methyl ester carboxylesterase
MSITVARHFVTVGQRRVHYSRAGSGPVVVILHASPVSFKASELVQRVYAEHFTVLAFDTPGFGLSDPLPLEQPEIEDFADALADTLDALGIDRVAVHGRHTGAQIAVEFAARHPARCSIAITDGFPIFDEPVRDTRPNSYLLPIVPEWDGSDLLWLWYRYREQYVFWPWNAPDAAHRADCDMPEPSFIQRGVLELLEAGDGYRVGYASAYRHRGLEVLKDLKVPVCFGWRPGDSLYEHRKRLPAECWSEAFPRDPVEAARAEMQCLLKHPAQVDAPPAPVCTPLPGRSTTQYIESGPSQVLVRRYAPNGQPDTAAQAPIVLIHPLPGSSALLEPLMAALASNTGREVTAFDLPGSGESIGPASQGMSVQALARAAIEILDRLGIGRYDLSGHQGGACVAVEMACLAPDRFDRLVLDAPVCLPSDQRHIIAARWLEQLGRTTPSEDGFHLLRIWHMRRDMSLWWPWFDRAREHTRQGPIAINPDQLTLEIREMIKQIDNLNPALAAVLSYPMAERLEALDRPVALCGRASDPWAPCLSTSADALGVAAPPCPGDDAEWVGALTQRLR